MTAALADRYRIEREIGRGGMGTVYLARDLKHDRGVAIKVLSGDVTSTLSADRFAREIRIAAQLTHPNILPLFDSGARDGFVYFVMPLLEGESLRERLDKAKQLAVEEVIQFATEIADALDYAHRHAIVHRDIKPENILLHEGHAVVADFGIGKAVSAALGASSLTQIGVSIGTPAYMSPEQAAGESGIDGRSDLFSLGCVLYELLTGEQAFTGPTIQAVIAKRFMITPPDVTLTRPSVPPPLAKAVARLLARDPGDRFATGAEFIEALRARRSAPAAANDIPSIAVLPFANMSADPDAEYFSDGMTEEILNALAKLSGLRVMARTSSFAFKGKNADVRTIGEQLGVAFVLEGSVRKSGNQLRITAQLIDAVQGHHLWSERYDRDMRDVFAVQDEITAAIRDALSERLLGIGPAPAPAAPAIDPATYEVFLRGRYLIQHRLEGAEAGIRLIEEVLRRAPAFAPAYYELATAHKLRIFYCAVYPREGWPIVRQLAEKAAALDPHFAPAHYALGEVAFYADWDWAKARRLYEHALSLDPNDADTLASLGMYWASLGHFDDSLRVTEQAVALDPLNPAVLVREMINAYLCRRYERAIARCDRTIELVADFPESYRWKGLTLMAMGRCDEAIRCFETAIQRSARHVWSVFDLGMALAAVGRMDEARAIAAELRARAATEVVPGYALTLDAVCRTPIDMDAYFLEMDGMFDQRGFWLVMLAVEPTFDTVRSDPRFAALVRRVGIPAAQTETA